MTTKYFDKNLIIKDLEIENKKEALEKLVNKFFKNKIINNQEEFLDSIVKRENVFSTGIGNGLAIPHCRSKSVKKFQVGILIPKNPIDFDSIDNKPVEIIFMLAVPHEQIAIYQKLLKSIAKYFKKKKNKKSILDADNKEEISFFLEEIENEM